MNQLLIQTPTGHSAVEVDSFEHATSVLMYELLDLDRDQRAVVLREWFRVEKHDQPTVTWEGCLGQWRVYRYLTNVERQAEPPAY